MRGTVHTVLNMATEDGGETRGTSIQANMDTYTHTQKGGGDKKRERDRMDLMIMLIGGWKFTDKALSYAFS